MEWRGVRQAPIDSLVPVDVDGDGELPVLRDRQYRDVPRLMIRYQQESSIAGHRELTGIATLARHLA